MSRARVNFWLYRTRGADGKLHPRWRFRYIGADGRMASGTGFTDKSETRRLAQQLAQEADEIRRGIRALPSPADTETLKPISEHVAAYLAWGKTQGGRGGRPWAAMHAINTEAGLRWWVETLKLRNLRDVTLASTEKALQEAKAAGAAPRTIQHKAAILATFLRWALKRKLLASYPLEGMGTFDSTVQPENIRRPLTAQEIKKLLAAASPLHGLIYRTAFETGFRAGEIQSLRAGDLDPKEAVMRLRAENAKNRKDALAPLSRALAEDLARHAAAMKPEEKLFPGFTSPHAARMIHRDLEAAGIPVRAFGGKAGFHSLRVSMVCHVVEHADAKTAQTLARHSDPRLTLNVYARNNAERLRSTVEGLGEAVRADENPKTFQTAFKREPMALAAGAETARNPLEGAGLTTGPNGWGARIRT